MNNVANILADKFGVGKPILTKEALEALSNYARSTTFTLLKDSVEEGSIIRFDRGVYYVSEHSTYLGTPLPLNPLAVLDKKYISNETDVYGFRSGLALQNDAGISNQVPTVLEITTNNETNRARRIKPMGGYREIILRKPRVPVNADNVDSLRFLDVLSKTTPSLLNCTEKEALVRMAKRAKRSQVTKYIPLFPKDAAVNLLESGVLNVIPA